jgi:glycerol-3-phosphate dehydrogenase (NAD(P)+)
MVDLDNAIAVIGAGSWGTALAVLLARNGVPTVMWGRETDHLREIDRTRRNSRFLPDIVIPEALRIETDLRAALAEARDVLVVVPSEGFRATLEQISALAPARPRLAWATKGFEPGTSKLLHEVANEVFADDMPSAVISGPTFAREVAAGLPTAVTVAANDASFAEHLVTRLHNERFRVYTTDDVIGVEVGGAVKNALAIAAGIADGLGFGANTRAALVTRGLTEVMRLGVALGGQRETFMGLAGLGDLVLTCTDNQSRNRRLGLALASGKTLSDAVHEIGQVVEGIKTVREVFQVAARLEIDMPICEQVYAVICQGTDPQTAVQTLLTRAQKSEALG